jgi:hypothetical protein
MYISSKLNAARKLLLDKLVNNSIHWHKPLAEQIKNLFNCEMVVGFRKAAQWVLH